MPSRSVIIKAIAAYLDDTAHDPGSMCFTGAKSATTYAVEGILDLHVLSTYILSALDSETLQNLQRGIERSHGGVQVLDMADPASRAIVTGDPTLPEDEKIELDRAQTGKPPTDY
jgi:hypothetical protein